MLQLTLPILNLAIETLQAEGKTTEDYDGWCGTVAEHTLERYEGQMVHVDGPALDQHGWWYHMVPLIDGKIHDAWLFDFEGIYEPQTMEDWLVKMFGTEDEITVTIDGDDVYTGLPQNYRYSPLSNGEVFESKLVSEGISADLRSYCTSGI